MALTNFALAQMTGQTTGNDLTTYVTQSGDINAVWVNQSAGPSMIFSAASRARPVASNASGSTYNLATATQDQVDVSVDLFVAATPAATVSAVGIHVGCDGTNTNLLECVSWFGSGSGVTSQIHLTNHVASAAGTDLVTPAFTFVAGTTYTLTLQIRGTAGSLTANILIGVKNSAQSTLASGIAIPSLVMSGRKIGLRANIFGNTAPSDTVGIHVGQFTAAGYTASALTAGTVSATPAPTTAALTLSGTANGTSPYSNQFQIAPDAAGSPGTFAGVGTASAATTYTATGLTQITSYWARAVTTDSASTPATVTTTAVKFTTLSGALVPGAVTAVPSSTSVALSAAAASGGIAPYTYQFQRAPDVSGSPGTFTSVGSSTTSTTLTDTGLTAGVKYWYQVLVSDSQSTPATATSSFISTTTSAPNFALTPTPTSVAAAQGGSISAVIAQTVVGGYSLVTTLSVPGLPSGVTASFSPATLTGAGTSTLTLTASGSAALGSYTLTVSSTDGTLTQTAQIAMAVTAVANAVTLDTVNNNVLSLLSILTQAATPLQSADFGQSALDALAAAVRKILKPGGGI